MFVLGPGTMFTKDFGTTTDEDISKPTFSNKVKCQYCDRINEGTIDDCKFCGAPLNISTTRRQYMLDCEKAKLIALDDEMLKVRLREQISKIECELLTIKHIQERNSISTLSKWIKGKGSIKWK